MPNIEIHGIGMRGVYVDDAYSLRNRIFALFGKKPYVQETETVVTIFDDEVTNVRKSRQPFLRVVSTPSEHLEEIVELLRTLDIDIEVQMLSAFFSKKSAPAG